MPTPAAGVIIAGYNELQRSFTKLGPAAKGALNEGLKESAEPTAQLAEVYSRDPERISGMQRGNPKARPAWAVTRIGVTQHAVYIVPKQRGIKGFDPKNRPNLVGLMLEQSFIPAMEENTPLVAERVTNLLKIVTDSMNTGGL